MEAVTSQAAFDNDRVRSRAKLRRNLLTLLAVALCVSASIGLYVRRAQARRIAQNRLQSTQNLKAMVLAVQLYHGSYGCFPPAVVRDSNGDPLYSGRVLLLPFLEQRELYDAFDKTQSWEAFPNRKLARRTPLFFSDRSSTPKVEGQTDYLFVVGKGTIFEPPQTGSSEASMTDGSSNTLCIVETKDSGVNWAEPRDLDFSDPIDLPAGNYRGFNLAVFFDLHVVAIRNGTSREKIRAAATCAGGETLTLP